MTDHYQPPRESAAPIPTEAERVEFFRRNEFREAVWKLAGLLLLLQAATTAALATMDSSFPQRAVLVVTAIALAGGSAASFLRSRKYLAMPDDERLVDRPVLLNLQVIAFSIVGIFLLVTALPALVGDLVQGYQSRQIDGSVAMDWPLWIYRGLQVLFGAVLFVSPEWIQRIWLAFRGYGK